MAAPRAAAATTSNGTAGNGTAAGPMLTGGNRSVAAAREDNNTAAVLRDQGPPPRGCRKPTCGSQWRGGVGIAFTGATFFSLGGILLLVMPRGGGSSQKAPGDAQGPSYQGVKAAEADGADDNAEEQHPMTGVTGAEGGWGA